MIYLLVTADALARSQFQRQRESHFYITVRKRKLASLVYKRLITRRRKENNRGDYQCEKRRKDAHVVGTLCIAINIGFHCSMSFGLRKRNLSAPFATKKEGRSNYI